MGKHENIRRNIMFHEYYSRLKNIALSVFEWEGLPDSCNARFLENALFEFGQAVFVRDPVMGYLTLRVTPTDTLNVYNEHLAYAAIGTNYHNVFNADECVLIRNNYMSKSTESTIALFAEKLARIDLTHDINIRAQKTPILIRCEEKTRTTLEAVYNQYEGDRPVIYGMKSLQDKPLEVLTTSAPYLADRIREEKCAVWNEALEFLGINTNPSDKKKERLIVNEVDANNEQIDIQFETMFTARKDACRAINALFPGLNVSVKKRIQTEESNPVEDNERGFEGGKVYN